MSIRKRGDWPTPKLERQRNALGTSVLFALPPQGLGTASVESLTSYVHRLAAEHDRRPSILLTHLVILPCQRDLGIQFRSVPLLTMGVNMETPTTRLLVAYIESLTWVPDVRRLVLLDRIGDVWTARSMRETRAWCPRCLREDRVPYDRLLWSFKTYRVCHVHDRALAEACDACGKGYRPFRARMRVTTCDCGASLLETKTKPARPGLDETLLVEFLMRIDQGRPVRARDVQSGIAHLVKVRGGITAAADAAGVHRLTVLTIGREGTRLELDLLLKFLRAAGETFAEFLSHRNEPIARRYPKKKGTPRRKPLLELKAALTAALELPDDQLPSARTIAIAHGVAEVTARKRFTALVTELGRRRWAHIREQRRIRDEAIVRDIKAEVREIYATTGRCNWAFINTRLAKSGLLRYPKAADAVEEVRAELLGVEETK